MGFVSFTGVNTYIHSLILNYVRVESVVSKKGHPFLQGGGEMGELTRAYDWAETSLGTPDLWPQSLRTALGIILHSKFPMFLFWGPKAICFYNDAYRPSLGNEGKHPYALGRPGAEIWPEIWKDIKPQIDEIMQGGDASWHEDQLLPIYRNGKLEDVYWTYSYSPVIDETGHPAGVFVTCTETTEKVRNTERLREGKEELDFAIKATELATWDFNPATNTLTGNERLRNWFALPPDGAVPIEVALNGIIEADRQRVHKAIEQAIGSGSDGKFDEEYAIINPQTGERRIVHAKGYAAFGEAGKCCRFAGTLQDVTEKVATRKKVEESEEKYRSLFQSMDQGFCVFEMIFNEEGQPVDYRFLEINPVFEAQTGLKNAVGKTARELVPGLESHWFELYGKVALTGEATSFVQGSEAMGRWFNVYAYRTGKPKERKVALLFTDITEQKKANERLKQSERNLRNTILQSPVAMCLLKGPDNIVEIANERIIELWGAKGRDVIGKSIFETVPEVKGQGFEDLLARVYTTGEPYKAFGVPLIVERENGLQTIYIDFVYDAYREADGKVSGIFAAATDVTDQMVYRQRLEESENRFRTMVQQSPVPIGYTRGRDMVFEAVNIPMLEIMGESDRIIGKRLEEVLPEIKEQLIANVLNKVWDTGQPFQAHEVLVVHRRGQQQVSRFYNLSYTPVLEDGTIQGIIHVAIDVTEQVLARQKTEQSEQRFYNLIRDANVGIVVLAGEEMVVSVVNAAYGRLINRTVEELLNKPLFDTVPDAEKPFRHLLDRVRLTGEPVFLYDTPYSVDSNGKKIEGYLNVVYQPYRESDGSISGVMALLQDVTEQVAARHKLEEANERGRLAIEAGELATVEVNFETHEVFSSSRMMEIFETEEGSGWDKFVSTLHPDDLPLRKKAYEKAFQDGQLEYEARVVKHDHSIRWIRAKGRVFFNEARKPVRLVSVVQDITREKAFSQELQKQVAERTRELERSNEELQQFAHVASHDLKEPVRKIKTFGSRMRMDFEKVLPDKAKLYLEKMESAATRIYSMIDGVLLYSSMNGLQQTKEQVDLNVVIRQIQDDLEVTIQETGAVISAESLPVIEGSSILLYQLFYNLVGNSLKFTRQGATALITISSELVTLPEPSAEAQPYAIIQVADNGIGFKQEQALNIFDTFTRLNSKDMYEGTGLGLALCKKIAERHGGSITAESGEGKGAIFTVLLPVNQD